jgi:hypothetical protein
MAKRGRKPGFKFKSTILKEAAREKLRQKITERRGDLVARQTGAANDSNRNE